MKDSLLELQNLSARIKDNPILHKVSLKIRHGETHVVMGPNGSGKSTLANVIMGNPKFTVTTGKIIFNSKNITDLSPDERAQAGIFLAFQYPREIAGVQLDRFLYMAYANLHNSRPDAGAPFSVFDFTQRLQAEMKQLGMNPEFSARNINEGFSGGEKKKAEMLQLAVLEPQLAILDETDSGLDIDALKTVAAAVQRFKKPSRGILMVTHYQRILQYLTPDVIHIMISGTIVKSGGPELAEQLEREGYERFKRTK